MIIKCNNIHIHIYITSVEYIRQDSNTIRFYAQFQQIHILKNDNKMQ